jgi:hypothetical protein
MSVHSISELRYERKFHTLSLSREDVLGIIKLHPANFRLTYPDRKVNNVYLDTSEFDCFNANVEGLPSRSKFRIRWYGETTGAIPKPKLEVKSKDNLVGSKDAYPLPSFTLDTSFTVQTLRDVLADAELPIFVRTILSDYRPILLNGYRRRYFESFNGSFRLTVDDLLHYTAMKCYGNRYLGKVLDDESIIVELKYGVDHVLQDMEIANALRLRMTKNSKYVTGVYAVYG